MTDKELRRLKRRDLLELLLEKTEENEKLTAELAEAKKQLDQRQIAVANAGSLAEAAVSINGMLLAADETARQYLDNIRDAEERCRAMTDNANLEAERIIECAKKKAVEIMKEANDSKTGRRKKRKEAEPAAQTQQNVLLDFEAAFEQMKKRNK